MYRARAAPVPLALAAVARGRARAAVRAAAPLASMRSARVTAPWRGFGAGPETTQPRAPTQSQSQPPPPPRAAKPDRLACWSCHTSETRTEGICSGCGALQKPEEEQGRGFFAMLGVPERFELDEKKLEHNFRLLQRKLHPDLHMNRSPRERQYAADHSAKLNEGYALLRDPCGRARYLLQRMGVKEIPPVRDATLLNEVLELREQIEEAPLETLHDLHASTRRTFDAMVQETGRAFAAGDREAILAAVSKLVYFNTALEALRARLPST